MVSPLSFLQLLLKVQEVSRTEISGEEIVTGHRNRYKKCRERKSSEYKHVYATVGIYPNMNIHFDCINWMNHVVQ
jgi:alkyl hydroperoxide reductase subunit AhpF